MYIHSSLLIILLFSFKKMRKKASVHGSATLAGFISISHAAGPLLAGTLSGCATSDASGASVTPVVTSSTAPVGFAPGGGLPALPASLVDSIQKGDFVDLRDLLPENVFEAFITAGDKDKEKKRKKAPIETFQDWVLSYTAWASTLWQLLPLGAWSSCNTWASLVVLPETIPHLSGCIMISSFGRWLLRSLSPRSGMSCTFNFSSGQNRRSLPPLHPETPVRGGMRDVTASIPLARGTTFARSAIELIELYLAPPLELHLILPRPPMGLGVLVLGQCLYLPPTLSLLPHTEAYL